MEKFPAKPFLSRKKYNHRKHLMPMKQAKLTETWLLLTLAHVHSSLKLLRQTRFIPVPGFVCKSHCHPLSPKVSLSWLPCSAAAKQLGEGGSGGGGLYANEMLTDPATITNHQSDLISWLTSWMSVWLATYQANPSPAAAPVSASTTLHIHNSLLGLHHWSMTVGAVCWCPGVKLFKIALNSSSKHNSQQFLHTDKYKATQIF